MAALIAPLDFKKPPPRLHCLSQLHDDVTATVFVVEDTIESAAAAAAERHRNGSVDMSAAFVKAALDVGGAMPVPAAAAAAAAPAAAANAGDTVGDVGAGGSGGGVSTVGRKRLRPTMMEEDEEEEEYDDSDSGYF